MDESIGHIFNYLPQDKEVVDREEDQIVDRALSEDRTNGLPVGRRQGSSDITGFASALGGGFFIGIIRRQFLQLWNDVSKDVLDSIIKNRMID